jgi:hypothetical protein
MSDPRDPDGLYEVLGASPDASAEELRDAYRREAFRWHPDRCDHPAAEGRMQRINAAREVLLDPMRRAAYDAEAASVVRVWCDVPVVDVGQVDVGAERVVMVPVRFSGDPARVGVVEVPRPTGPWWSLEVVAPAATDDADVLVFVRVTVRPRTAQVLRDTIEVVVAGERVLVHLACQAVVPRTTVWSSGFRRWCRVSAFGLLACLWFVPSMLGPLSLVASASQPTATLRGALLVGVTVLVGVLAWATQGFARGSRGAQVMAGAVALPASAVLALWLLAVVAAVVVFVVALVVVGLVVSALIG